MRSPEQEKRLFAAGRLGPWSLEKADKSPVFLEAGTDESATACNNRKGPHEGPLVGTEEYDAHPEAHWHGTGKCAACGSNIHRSQLRRIA
jgi:hypothetical protein